MSCSQPKRKSTPSANSNTLLEIPEKTVSIADLHYDHKQSLWMLNELPYSGFAESYYPNHRLMEKFGILNGKKQGEYMQWYSDGHLKNVANYYNGKLNGQKKIWSKDSTHVLIAQFNYYRGKAHGEQKKWYTTGELFKQLHLNMGKEEGLQQAYRKNGALFANYEAREGRIFGLKKAALCFGLEDKNDQLEK